MDGAVRNLVRQRAGNRCEYCRLPQAAVDATFHVDHIIAQQHLDVVMMIPIHWRWPVIDAISIRARI